MADRMRSGREKEANVRDFGANDDLVRIAERTAVYFDREAARIQTAECRAHAAGVLVGGSASADRFSHGK